MDHDAFDSSVRYGLREDIHLGGMYKLSQETLHARIQTQVLFVF